MRNLILVLSLLSISATTDWTSDAEWMSDGWKADFGPGVCYLWHTYHDLDRRSVGVINIAFIQVANQVALKSGFKNLPLLQSLNEVGIAEAELIFSISAPGRKSLISDEPIQAAISISVSGVKTTQLDLSAYTEDYEMRNEFFVREPKSRTFLKMFKNPEKVQFTLVLPDKSNIIFYYDDDPRGSFKIRLAQFNACIDEMSPNQRVQFAPAAPDRPAAGR